MKDIVSLRNQLFDQLNRLAEASKDDLETEVQRAASIVQVSETIVKTAEVENQFIAITKSFGSGFVPVVDISAKPRSLINHIEEKIAKDGNAAMFDESKEKNWIADSGQVDKQKKYK